MNWLKSIFWGEVIVCNLFVFMLFITSYFEFYSVFWWLYTAKYAVLYIASAGVMLGLSLELELLDFTQIKKRLMTVRAFLRTRITRILASLYPVVKHQREGK